MGQIVQVLGKRINAALYFFFIGTGKRVVVVYINNALRHGHILLRLIYKRRTNGKPQQQAQHQQAVKPLLNYFV